MGERVSVGRFLDWSKVDWVSVKDWRGDKPQQQKSPDENCRGETGMTKRAFCGQSDYLIA